MRNPFKFGTIVEEPYFTDRMKELEMIKHAMNSANHLILISPRRFGKSSLVRKALNELNRPFISINLQKVVNVEDLASLILKEAFKIHPWEKIKHIMTHFRVVPTVSSTPAGDTIDIQFQPTIDSTVILEDALALLERVSDPANRLIVVFDEFQEIMGLSKNLDKKMRAIIQEQQKLNYIFLGSQESMMTEIFEHKKSPFYHFGLLMHLKKIPRDDFYQHIVERLPKGIENRNDIANDILKVTNCHPYYTQQLASQVWEALVYQKLKNNVVNQAVNQITMIHDLDFERLWLNFNKSDRRVFQTLCRGRKIADDRSMPTSTLYSTINRLIKQGYVIKTNDYEIEDPFFEEWISRNQL